MFNGIDDEEESRREYYYDLVLRAAKSNDILAQLKDSRYMKAFKEKIKDNLLPNEDTELMLDPDKVDWEDFHQSYLESISNCRGATSMEKAAIKSHDQLDILFRLSDELHEQYPSHIANDTSANKEFIQQQWRSRIDTFAQEYARIVNNSIQHSGLPDLETKVRSIIQQPWAATDNNHDETIYFVAGAVVNIIKSQGEQCAQKYKSAYKDLVSNTTLLDKEEAREASLPLGKVERREKVRLTYVNSQFYTFVKKVESVFHKLLNEGDVVLYGALIVRDITRALSKNELGFKDLFTEQHDEEVISEVLKRIIWSYGRLRGKDFIRKCTAREGAKYYEKLRSELGTASAMASKKAKEGKKSGSGNEEEEHPRWKFLMRLKKKDLVTRCKNRGLKVTGTKKVLTKRIIDYDDEQTKARKEQNTTQQQSIGIEEDEDYMQDVIADMNAEDDALISDFDDMNDNWYNSVRY